jgi:lauroyl/myristoyl acyltransferase
MPNASKIIHLLAYGLYLACTRIARLLPLKFVFVAGQCLGVFGYHVLRNRRKVAIGNLMVALDKSEAEASVLARQHFMNLCANLLSALKISTMTDEEILACVTVEIPPGLVEQAKEAAKGGTGWVAMISHMGNWEIFSHLTPLFPYFKFGAIYHKLANDYVDRHFKEGRANSGVTLFDRREGYLKCVAFIRAGGAVGVLVDQYAGLPGTWMPFFRRLTSTSTLAATLAERAGTDVVPIAITTTGIARWHVAVSMPLPRNENPEILTAAINKELESQIRKSPPDWLWSHNRWKTPRWVFLFTRSGRRVFYPPDFDPSTLIPYRILVRAPDGLEEAKASVPALLAIKGGRPDAHVTVVTGEETAEFWKNVAGTDGVIPIAAGESAREAGEKIKNAGRFDVGVLFSADRRAALEIYHGDVPYRIGPPHRFRLNDWKNAPGKKAPPERGEERYNRIAQAIGAHMDPMLD